MAFENLPKTLPCLACEGTGRLLRNIVPPGGDELVSIRACTACEGRAHFTKPDMTSVIMSVLSKTASGEIVTKKPDDRRRRYVWAKLRFETGVTEVEPLQPYAAVMHDPYLCMLDYVAEYAAMCLIKRYGPRKKYEPPTAITAERSHGAT